MNWKLTLGGGPSRALCCAVAASLLLTASFKLQAAPVSYQNTFANYGTVANSSCAAAPNGICAAVASINSFVFLKTTYPATYGGTTIDKGNFASVAAAAQGFAVNGWTSPGGTARQGYYQRAGDVDKNFWETKIDWLEDFGAGKTRYAGQVNAPQTNPNTWYKPGGVTVQSVYPTWPFLLQQMSTGEDIELVIRNAAGAGHAITLTGISFNDMGAMNGLCDAGESCMLKYQDPNDPTNEKTVAASFDATNMRLAFSDATTFMAAVYIDAAFSESPIPEPGTFILIVISLTIAVGLRRPRATK
jgi:hypothetical protein